MKAEVIVQILRLILCNQEMLAWLEEQAAKTNTPIDDMMVGVLKLLLCGQK